MDSKELRGLMEAYSDVYAPQENIEEGLRSAVKRLLGGGKKEAEASKPESRGAELRRRYNVGPEKSDTSAKRQILNRSRARAERDERDYGSSKYSKSVAQKSKAAHERYLKAGYSKYGADDARGSGNKARKRAAALNREEFEFIVNALIEEGYDLSSYTWDEMYEICLDEALTGERYKKVMKKPAGTAYSRMVSADPAKRATRGGRGGESDFGAGDRGSGNRAARRAGTYQEELDIFDVVLEFLQAEGYAETLEEAEWMMANMIDEEAIEIVIGEAQHARENPEKYEREQAKKSAPVRGERTPMPPRGDKRREDFEKWYAKQMGR
jgi:hypothetical protein